MNGLCALEKKVYFSVVGNAKLVDNVVQVFPILTDFLPTCINYCQEYRNLQLYLWICLSSFQFFQFLLYVF